jgi:hypothetical protein
MAIAPLSAAVAILMLADLVRSPITITGTMVDARYSPSRFGWGYELAMRSDVKRHWVDVSRGFFETSRNGDVLAVSYSPLFQLQGRALRVGPKGVIYGRSAGPLINWFLPFCGFMPLIAFSKRIETKGYWGCLFVGSIYLVIGWVGLFGLPGE